MKSLSVTVAMAASLVLAAPSTEAAPPPIDNAADYQDIVDNLLLPAGQILNAALSQAATDQTKACASATTAHASLVEAEKRLQALADRMTAEGDDATILDPLKTNVAAGKPQYETAERSICSGEMTAALNDPKTKAITDTINSYMIPLNDDLLAAQAALIDGDTPTACARSHAGKIQIDGISAYLASLPPMTPDLNASMAGLAKKIDGFRIGNDARLKDCPANP